MSCRSVALAALLSLAAGCGSSGSPADDQRLTSQEEHCSIIVPPGWTDGRELGTLVLAGAAAQGQDRNTITIRSVPRTGDWVEPRTAELVFPATERALRALPAARVGQPQPLAVGDAVGDLDGLAFDLSFVPPGKRERYERRHAVLVGAERVIHVVHTAPAGRLARSAAAFEAVLASLREEV